MNPTNLTANKLKCAN